MNCAVDLLLTMANMAVSKKATNPFKEKKIFLIGNRIVVFYNYAWFKEGAVSTGMKLMPRQARQSKT